MEMHAAGLADGVMEMHAAGLADGSLVPLCELGPTEKRTNQTLSVLNHQFHVSGVLQITHSATQGTAPH